MTTYQTALEDLMAMYERHVNELAEAIISRELHKAGPELIKITLMQYGKSLTAGAFELIEKDAMARVKAREEAEQKEKEEGVSETDATNLKVD